MTILFIITFLALIVALYRIWQLTKLNRNICHEVDDAMDNSDSLAEYSDTLLEMCNRHIENIQMLLEMTQYDRLDLSEEESFRYQSLFQHYLPDGKKILN